MKKFLLFVTVIFAFSFTTFSQSTTFGGNGKSDFGGAVGLGKINITTTIDSVFFTFTKGPGLFDSVLVIYLDAQPGGIASTSGSTPSTDIYYRATTGYNTPTQQSIVNFPASFQPDAAIAFDKNGGEVFYWLFGFMIPGSTFSITPTGINNSPTYSAGFAKTDLGATPGATVAFNFMGTYIGANCYRSTEGFGDTTATVARLAVTGNTNRTAGYNTYNPKTFFTYSSLNTLPVKLLDFKATTAGNEVAIGWYVAEESNIDQYQVQRSSNGIAFNTISTVKAGNSAIPTSYNIKDENPANGANYYRLAIKEGGRLTYSGVVLINFNNQRNAFTAIYDGSNINLTLNGVSAGNYKLSVLSTDGQLVLATNFVHDGSANNRRIAIVKNISAGIYRVALRTKGATYTTNVVVP